MRKSIKISYILILIFLILISLIFITASFLPFDIFKVKIGLLAPDKDFKTFSEDNFSRIKLLCPFFVLITVIFGILRKKIYNYFNDLILSWKIFIKDLKNFIIKIYSEDKVFIYILTFIFLAGIGLRLYYIYQPIRHDEAISFLTFAREPLYRSLSDYSTSNNHLLHTFFLRISYLIFGNQIWAIRLPAFVAGVLIIPAVYLLGRTLYNKNTALLSASLVAVSSILVFYSTNARGYTLVCLFSILILTLAKYLKDNDNKTGWMFFSILSALGFFSMPIFLYPYGITILWILLSLVFNDSLINKKTLLKNMFISIIITISLVVMLYSPAIIFSNTDTGIVSSAIESHKLAEFLKNLPNDLINIWKNWNMDIPLGVSITLIIGFIASFFVSKKFKSYKVHLLFPILLWLIPLILIQRPTMFERVWLFLLPIFFILASSGIVYILEVLVHKIFSKTKSLQKTQNIFISVIMPILIISLTLGLGFNSYYRKSIYFSNETGTLLNAEEITLYLKKEIKPNDKIILGCPSEWPLKYYFDKYGLSYEYVNKDINKSSRIVVIINRLCNQNLEDILEWQGINPDDIKEFDDLKLAKKFSTADIYIADRAIDKYINNLYKYFLGEKPKKADLDFWIDSLSNQKNSCSELIYSLFNSQVFKNKNLSNEDYIYILYKSLLTREPDESGFRGWVNQLEEGRSREEILNEFLKSEEYKDICNLYNILP